MIPQPPPGQGPIDPRGAFTPAPPAQPAYPQPGTMQQQQQSGPPPFGAQPQGPPMYPPMMPPPMMMPPPFMQPPFMQPPRRGGVGKVILFVLLLLLLGGSVLVNVLLMGSSLLGGGMASADGTIHQTITAGDSDQQIAIVPLVGVIDSGMSQQVERYLEQAQKNANVKALVLQIDSPGGTVTASDEIYARILRFKQEKKVPVIVSMGSLATSGGYYAACAGDYLFAQETTLTGNIGVLMPRFNLSKLMEKYGVEENTIVSEGAKFKNAGSTFSPDTPEATQYMQGIANSMFSRFKDVVKSGRGAKIASIDTVADGRAFTAQEAKSNGLIDGIGYLGDAIAYAKKTASLSNPSVVRYSRPPSLFDIFGASSNLPGTHASGPSTVNGVNVNFDRKLVDELLTPRVLYLWRGE
jgi:protease-4